MTSTWTPERVARAEAMWAEGKSGSEIGKELGVTRNAVIGIAHRRKWTKRASPQPAVPRPRKPRPSRAGNPFNHHRPKTPRTPPEIKAVRPVTMPPDPLKARMLALVDLTDHTCKWPIGDPGTKGFGFCGHPPVSGLPYCPYHARMSVGAGTYSERRAV